MGRLERFYLILSFIIQCGGFLTLFMSTGGDAADLGESNSLSTISNVLVLGLTCLLILRRPRPVLRCLPGIWPILALVALAFVSASWSDYPDITVHRSASLMTGALWAIYVAARYDLDEVLGVLRTAFGIMAVASLAVGVALPTLGREDPLGAPGWRGIFANKNELGVISAVGAATYFHTLIATRQKVMSFGIHAILLLLCLLVLYLAKSSTSIVIFVLGALLSSLIKLTHKRVGIAIIIWTTIVLLLAPTVLIVTDQLAAIAPLLGRDSQLTGRVDLWLLLPSYIAERPWLGYGLGGFWVADSTNVALIWDTVGWNPPHAHEGWLDLLLELGIVGLALLSLQLLLTVMNGIRAVVDGLGPGVQYIVMTTLIMLVFNIAESSLVRPGAWWILITIGATGLARITKEREPAAKRYARRYRSSMGRPGASGAMSEGRQ